MLEDIIKNYSEDLYGNVTVYFNNSKYINKFQASLMTQIRTFAIEYVMFHINSSSVNDEHIAKNLGMLPLDNTKLDEFPFNKFSKASFSGPCVVNSNDLPNISCKENTPIIELCEGQLLTFEYKLKKNTAEEHVKWRPVSSVCINTIKEETVINFKNI